MMKKLLKVLLAFLAVMTAASVSFTTGFADGDMKIYCGISVPRSDFDYPDNSEREYTMSEFDSLFAGNAKERYFKSQIFIDEIFVRYGYNFSARKKAPGKVIYDKYIQADWYPAAIKACPTQDQLTLMYSYMSSVELRNIENVNTWQQNAGIDPFDNPGDISYTVSPITKKTEAAPVEKKPEPEQEEAVPDPQQKYVDRIKAGTDYEAKDFSGTGSTDRIQLMETDDALALIYGKSILDLPASAKVWYYHYDDADAFLLIDSGDDAVPGYVQFLAPDEGGHLAEASEEIGAYLDVRISRIDKDGLIYLSTGPLSGNDSVSFRYCTDGLFRVTEKYHVNSEKHGVFRRSNYGEFEDELRLKYIGAEPAVLSTSGKKYDAEGPVLYPGDEVNFTRVYFEYEGTDALSGNHIYEIEFDGGKGWIREDESIQFSDDPEAEVLSAEPEVTPVPEPAETPAPVPTETPVPEPAETPAPVPTEIPVPVQEPEKEPAGISLSDLIGMLIGGTKKKARAPAAGEASESVPSALVYTEPAPQQSAEPASGTSGDEQPDNTVTSGRRREASVSGTSGSMADSQSVDDTGSTETGETRRREASVKGGQS